MPPHLSEVTSVKMFDDGSGAFAVTPFLVIGAAALIFLFPPIGICFFLFGTALYMLNRFAVALLLLWLCVVPVELGPGLSYEQINFIRVASACVLFIGLVWRRSVLDIPSAARGHLIIYCLLLCTIMLSSWNATGRLYVPIPLLMYLLVFVLFSIVFADPKLRMPVIAALILGAMSSAFVALVQYLIVQYGILNMLSPIVLPANLQQAGHLELMRSEYAEPYRVLGTLYSPNVLGPFLTMVFPFSVGFRWIQGKPPCRWINMATFCSACLMLTVILLTKSRAAMLGTVLASLVMVLAVQTRKTFMRALFLAFGFLVILVLMLYSTSSLRDSLRLDKGMRVRPFLWAQAVDIIVENPILGAGAYGVSDDFMQRFSPGTFTFGKELMKRSGPADYGFVYHSVRKSMDRGTMELIYYDLTPHSVVLYLGVQAGICGLIVFGCLITSLLCHQVRRVLAGHRRVIAPLAATVAILAASVFDVVLFYSIAVTTVFAIASAMSYCEEIE